MKLEPALSRRDVIAARLATGSSVLASSLAIEFDVSEDAIRRDLRALATEGLCRRVYGGALPKTPQTKALPSRLKENQEVKAELARAAAATIRPGELVFIDCGSTNAQLIEHLPFDLGITVATNSPHIAALAATSRQVPLLLVGGMLDPAVGGCVDAAAIAVIRELRIDRTFIGGCSITPSSGVHVESFAEAQFKKNLLGNSRHRVMMATSDKFTGIAPFHVCDADGIDVLFAEATLSDGDKAELETAGYRITRLHH